MPSYIKLDRKILKWEWYQDIKVYRLFTYFLITAEFKDCQRQGHPLKRGQLIFTRRDLVKETGLTEQEIRTCIDKLKSTGEIHIIATHCFSIITICKYDVYQGNGIGQQPSSNPENNPENNPVKTEKSTQLNGIINDCETNDCENFSPDSNPVKTEKSTQPATQPATHHIIRSIKEDNTGFIISNEIINPGQAGATVPEKLKTAEQVKIEYSAGIDKTSMKALIKFVKENRPAFYHPYFALWNLYAEKYNRPKVKTMTDARIKKLYCRLKENDFDFLEILAAAKDSDFLMQSGFFGFDWIIKSQENYLKVLELKYKNPTLPNKGTATETTAPPLKLLN